MIALKSVMSILDLATRYDQYNGTGTDLDPLELTIKWIIANDSGRVSCKIVHNTIENHIYVEDLSVTGSNNARYGQQLFEGVLNYLDLHYPGVPIVLNDASVIGSGEWVVSLWIAILLRRGELSYYSRFGFVPCHVNLELIDYSYATLYANYSERVKSLTSREAVTSFNRYKNRYSWVNYILVVLSGRDDKLMIDEIVTSELDLTQIGISDIEFDDFIKNEWSINRHDVLWIRQV